MKLKDFMSKMEKLLKIHKLILKDYLNMLLLPKKDVMNKNNYLEKKILSKLKEDLNPWVKP
jgi:hypothetical protein